MNQETSSLLEDYMPCGMEESTLHRKDTTALEKKVRQKAVHDRAVHVSVKQLETEQELKDVLAMCYDILGADNSGLYGYDAWYQRFLDGRQPLVFAEKDGKPVSAVLGRAENEESLVIGFTACREEYRKQGITGKLMNYFEELAREKGFKYITLGSKEDRFYEKCGYKVIFQVHGQNIFQKVL